MHLERNVDAGFIDEWKTLAYYKYVLMKISKEVKQINLSSGAKLDEETYSGAYNIYVLSMLMICF